jgi:CTP:phosphocholine cytidylyltransferase-like protein
VTGVQTCALPISAEIHHQLVSVYGEDVMNRQIMTEQCHEFEAEVMFMMK